MAINLRDWSTTAAQRGWGPGWPSCSGVVQTFGTAVVTADTSGTRMSVNKRIARLVDLLIDETERRGYLLKSGQCGGYNCRAISGTRTASNHSWALAVDLNWNDNPYTSTGKHTIPQWVYDLWARYGFANGSMYSGPKKDWMHLEFMGGPADADAMTALALIELTGKRPAPAPKPAPAPAPAPGGRPVLRRGASGPAVTAVQKVLAAWYPSLRLAVDGEFGPGTENAVKQLQRNSRLTVDGVVGPATYRALKMA